MLSQQPYGGRNRLPSVVAGVGILLSLVRQAIVVHLSVFRVVFHWQVALKTQRNTIR